MEKERPVKGRNAATFCFLFFYNARYFRGVPVRETGWADAARSERRARARHRCQLQGVTEKKLRSRKDRERGRVKESCGTVDVLGLADALSQ